MSTTSSQPDEPLSPKSRCLESQALSPDDTVSDTSTIIYGEESFDTYQSRVKQLVRRIWPHTQAEGTKIERMSGGDFNRIIGISIQNSWNHPSDDYVLRVPRTLERALEEDQAPLEFLRIYSNIPSPEIVRSDTTEANALESPYMIQRRIRGKQLLYEYPSIPSDVRRHIARQLGEVTHFLLSLRSHRIGSLSMTQDKGNFVVGPPRSAAFGGQEEPWTFEDKVPWQNIPAKKDFKNTLLELLNLRRANLKDDPVWAHFSDKFIQMVNEMECQGYLHEIPITFCHLDFEPRNILIDKDTPETPVSGILDWDSAMFGPAFMACKPPTWLWAWKDDENEDEREANDIPELHENRELKRIFEEAAGPAYVRFAYAPAYRMLRQVMDRLINGFNFSQDFHEAEVMLKEWEELKQGY